MAITLRIGIPQVIKRHKKKTIAGAIILVLLGFGIWRMTRPKPPEVVTAVAERGDLRQTVEAVGTIVSERELELRFAGAGIVSSVNVKEGDKVVAGQKLAQLRGSGLAASIASQQASLDSAMADLRTLEEGTRPEDITIAEADVASKKASLQVARQTLASAEQNMQTASQQLATLQQEADVALSGQVSTAVSSISEQLTAMENSLSTIEDVLSRTDVNDAIVKNQPAALNDIRTRQRAAMDAIVSARKAAASVAANYQSVIDALRLGNTAGSASTVAMDMLFSVISSLQETQYFSASARESLKSSIGLERSRIRDAASAIASALSSFQNSAAGYDTRIATQQSAIITAQGTRDKAQTDILTYEAAVRAGEAQLALKRSGSRPTDIDAARARVRQQQAMLARSRADYSDTVLTAPVSGTITHVNIRIGESLPAGAAVTLLGESPYRVEMFVSEIDIPKVVLTQSGSIELDAFRGTNYALRVGDIDPTSTDKEGVPKYRVRLDFVHPHTELKIGMTGDAEIVTGMRPGVVYVPQRAVLENEDGDEIVRVQTEDGDMEERVVVTGMEGEGGDVEIIDGIEEGDIVIVLVKQ